MRKQTSDSLITEGFREEGIVRALRELLRMMSMFMTIVELFSWVYGCVKTRIKKLFS